MWKRYRFKEASKDYRPVKFPPPGPYWCSGYDSDDNAVIVAYLPADAELTDWWPEPIDIEVEDRTEITFTDRFSKPDWYPGESNT